jgi:hypothetical protein
LKREPRILDYGIERDPVPPTAPPPPGLEYQPKIPLATREFGWQDIAVILLILGAPVVLTILVYLSKW